MERERKRNQCLAQNLGQKRNKMEDKRGETEGKRGGGVGGRPEQNASWAGRSFKASSATLPNL